MTTTTADPRRDEFGVTHRLGCSAPGYEAHHSTLPGWLLLRCQHCDATRLTRSGAR